MTRLVDRQACNKISQRGMSLPIEVEDTGCVRLHARPHPLKDQRVDRLIPSGGTIAEIFATVQPNPVLRRGASIYIDDWYISEDLWHVVKPKPGRFVQISAVYPEMGGGGGGKSPLRMVLMLAVVAASILLPGLILGAMGVAANTAIVGSLTVGQAVGFAIPMPGSVLLNATDPWT